MCQKGLESHHHCEEWDILKYLKNMWRTMIFPFNHLGVFTCSSSDFHVNGLIESYRGEVYALKKTGYYYVLLR